MRPAVIVSVVILLGIGNVGAQVRTTSAKAPKATPVRVTVKAQDGAAQAEADVFTAFVSIYRAFGGIR